jgi:FixJ family two-component response regulator
MIPSQHSLSGRPPLTPLAPASTEPTVHVVDDDELVLRSLRRQLTSAGMRVETFASLGDLLQSPHCGGPGCLLLDVCLPGLDGFGLYNLLQAADCAVPTIFMSGRGDVPTSVRAMKAGAIDFLEKPFSDEELLAAVASALEKDRTARRARAEVEELERRVAALTPREEQVFSLVVTGMLNKQVATRIGTTEKTVKVHRARVMQKLRANSLADLVRRAQSLQDSPPVGDAGNRPPPLPAGH